MLRSIIVADCLKRFAEDEGIQRAFYAIEYGTFKYDDNFHESNQEQDVDRLLRHFSNTALAWQAGLLSIRDIRPVQYYVLRIIRDPEIQKYLKFIEGWSKEQNLGEHPYAVLNLLCSRLEIPQR